MIVRTVIGIACLFWPVSCLQAKPTLTGFAPRSAQIGAITEITAQGTFAKWPVKIWVNRPGLEIKLGSPGKLSIKTSKTTLPGIYWIRFLDDTGASQAVPLILDSLQTVIATEPNESLKQPQPISLPANVSGVLEKGGDVDCYRVQCNKGQVLVARMVANPLFGTSMDGVLQICNERGFVLDQNDDRHGIDPCLSLKIPRDGSYYIRTFAFP
ncbi:MAG: serine protease, partial [Planctomycetota bacterium]|nr:serine protease [Planctomycetota bacterium]